MGFFTTKRCKSRKVRKCPGCRTPGKIQPGDYYLMHTEFPGGDAGYADAAGHPVRMAECAECATRYGRADEIAGITP